MMQSQIVEERSESDGQGGLVAIIVLFLFIYLFICTTKNAHRGKIGLSDADAMLRRENASARLMQRASIDSSIEQERLLVKREERKKEEKLIITFIISLSILL